MALVELSSPSKYRYRLKPNTRRVEPPGIVAAVTASVAGLFAEAALFLLQQGSKEEEKGEGVGEEGGGEGAQFNHPGAVT
jgi:hypothetical protein